MFRRYRDLSIFAFIGVYLISIIDAYVDAELSNFDITPDLSMKVEPAVIDNNNQFRSNSFKNDGTYLFFFLVCFLAAPHYKWSSGATNLRNFSYSDCCP